MDEPLEWTKKEWDNLLLSIKLGECTPFIGSGASAEILPTGRKLADEWATEVDYPFADRENLQKVAQFIAVEEGGRVPKLKVVAKFRPLKPPNFNEEDEPHRVMADLRLPIYITTNYDDYMYRALLAVNPPDKVKRELCPWHLAGDTKPPVVKVRATSDSPVVFHLHGTLDVPDSIVITEDDYLDFLMAISEIKALIPTQILGAFKNSSLLFLGYSLDDTDFKLILRRMASYLHRGEGPRHVAVQLAPRAAGQPPTQAEIDQVERQQTYLERHYGLQKVRVYWGTCRKFAGQLAARWKDYPK